MSENLRIVAAKWKENAWILGTFFVEKAPFCGH
jgi:hypothetical protein